MKNDLKGIAPLFRESFFTEDSVVTDDKFAVADDMQEAYCLNLVHSKFPSVSKLKSSDNGLCFEHSGQL